MNIQEKINATVSKFSMFEDWMDKYQLLIEMGKDAPLLKDEEKSDKYLIQGCQSRLWLKAELQDGKMKFKVNSDAVITLGIATLLINVFDGETPAIITQTPVDFIDEIGLREHLSPTRSNGLTAMVKQMKLYAMAFSIGNS
ncbi:MAG: SufE family protein [Bacteroidales bacterium]|jgi:cysteine desulfuration protein SufE|nr:SufE family protein [Bacteroidales bacterium]